MDPASAKTSCHALLTSNLTLSLSPCYIPQTNSIRPPHSRSQSVSSTRSSSSRRSSTSSTVSYSSTSSVVSSGSLASISSTYKVRPPFAKAPLHLPTTFVTVSNTPAPIIGNMYVKLYGQSMSGETVSVNLCDGTVKEELTKLASEGTERVRVVQGVKFMFVGVDR